MGRGWLLKQLLHWVGLYAQDLPCLADLEVVVGEGQGGSSGRI